MSTALVQLRPPASTSGAVLQVTSCTRVWSHIANSFFTEQTKHSTAAAAVASACPASPLKGAHRRQLAEGRLGLAPRQAQVCQLGGACRGYCRGQSVVGQQLG